MRLLASNVGNPVTYRAVYDCMHHVGFIAGHGNDGYWATERSFQAQRLFETGLMADGIGFEPMVAV